MAAEAEGWAVTRGATNRGGGRTTPVRSLKRAMAAIGAFLLIACSDPAGPSEPDLRGTWDAESAIATNPAQPSVVDDLIADGITIRLIIGPGGSVELHSSVSTFTEVEHGSITTREGTVSLVLDGEVSTGSYTLVDDVLTLDLRTGVAWDFDDDGEDEPATMVIALRRR